MKASQNLVKMAQFWSEMSLGEWAFVNPKMLWGASPGSYVMLFKGWCQRNKLVPKVRTDKSGLFIMAMRDQSWASPPNTGEP